jgi:hypothetical protein
MWRLAHHHRHKRYLVKNNVFQRNIDKITPQVGTSHDPLIKIPDDNCHDWDSTVLIEKSLRHVLHSTNEVQVN